jgi:hypothetical protein
MRSGCTSPEGAITIMMHDPIELFLAPFVLFVYRPWLAVLPTAVFAIAGLIPFMARRREEYGVAALLLACGGAWAAYALYEWRMSLWSQTVIAPIRIDMFVVAPVLYLVTAVGLWGVSTLGRFRVKARSTKERSSP